MRSRARAAGAAAAAALALWAPAVPALAVTRVPLRPAARVPVYIPPPPRVPLPAPVPTPDGHPAIAAQLAADRAQAEQAAAATAAALAANAGARSRPPAAAGDEATSGRALTAAQRAVDRAQSRLDALQGRLEAALAATQERARRAAEQEAALPGRPLPEAQADANLLDGDTRTAVDAALQAVFDEARADLENAVGDAGAPTFVWPEGQFEISQGFGPSDLEGEPPFAGFNHFHLGVDLAAPEDTPVAAAAAGVVVLVGAPATGGRFMGLGNFVVIAHGGQVDTLYGHLDQASVQAGDIVRAGDPIGLEGSTGYSTGPHLHFEAHAAGRPFDPTPLLPPR